MPTIVITDEDVVPAVRTSPGDELRDPGSGADSCQAYVRLVDARALEIPCRWFSHYGFDLGGRHADADDAEKPNPLDRGGFLLRQILFRDMGKTLLMRRSRSR
jgi:hypothetical protein